MRISIVGLVDVVILRGIRGIPAHRKLFQKVLVRHVRGHVQWRGRAEHCEVVCQCVHLIILMLVSVNVLKMSGKEVLLHELFSIVSISVLQLDKYNVLHIQYKSISNSVKCMCYKQCCSNI